jgi:hypothetical protein
MTFCYLCKSPSKVQEMAFQRFQFQKFSEGHAPDPLECHPPSAGAKCTPPPPLLEPLLAQIVRGYMRLITVLRDTIIGLPRGGGNSTLAK